jgi:YidC/Oxa1 family membrane protein insertase
MPSQLRNYVLFFLSFILIYAGYFWVRNYFWPPPKPVPVEDRAALERTARMLASVAGAGLADAASITTEAVLSRADKGEWWLAAKKDEQEKQAKAKPPEPAPPPKPASPAETIVLGDSDAYHLRVTLVNRGAGVHDLTLTKFKAADWYGRPEKAPNGQPLPLHLIPPSDTPSFALYHYATADDKELRPLDTLGKRDWTVVEKKTDGDEQRVGFATELPEFGVRITKTFTLKPREYHLGLSVKIARLPGAMADAKFRYQLAGGHGLPIEGVWYTSVFRNAIFDWVPNGGGDIRNLTTSQQVGFKGGTDRIERNQNYLQYAAVATQYFASAIVVDDNDQPNKGFIQYVRATVEGEEDPHHQQLDDITVRTIAEPVAPKPGEAIEHKYLLYHGPVKVRLLEKLGGEGGVDATVADRYERLLHLNTLTDYGQFSGGTFSFWTDAIIFFTNVVHTVIGALRWVVPNDAICIILVTVLVRLVMLPLSRKQTASMAKQQEAMGKLQPEIKKIKERFKNDLVTQQQETMALYRKHGVNPAAGLGGCLMLLVQMPIFLGLYFALQESFFFRLEPLASWIPHWMPNLAAPDMLFWWSENIPFVSERSSMGSFFYLGPYFNLLPVVALALMFAQMKYMQPPPADEQLAQQQKTMQYVMIPMFAFLFYKMPSGLCLYFIASTMWGLAERKLLPKKKPAAEGRFPSGGNGPPPRGGPRGRGKPPPKPPEPPGKLREWWERLLKEASKK